MDKDEQGEVARRTRRENNLTHKQNPKSVRTFIKSIRETLSPNR